MGIFPQNKIAVPLLQLGPLEYEFELLDNRMRMNILTQCNIFISKVVLKSTMVSYFKRQINSV